MNKKIIFVLTLLLFSATLFSQDCNFLSSQNGFRNIKLGGTIKDHPEFVLKDDRTTALFQLSFNSSLNYVYVGKETDMIGSAKILFIYLNVNNDTIERIHVVTQKEFGLYSILKNAYGATSFEYGKKWIWRSDTIECSIEGDDNNIPGYHIVYSYLSDVRIQLKERASKRSKAAQMEL